MTGLFVFAGCKPDTSGNCQALVDFEITLPSGKRLGKVDGADFWRDKPSPSPATLELAVAMVNLRAEPPFGRYVIKAITRDMVAVESHSLEVTFAVQP